MTEKFNLYASETKNVDIFINLGNDVYDAFDKIISFVENAKEAVKRPGFDGFLTCKNISDYWSKLSTWNKFMTDKCAALKTRLSKISNDRVKIEFLKEAGAELNWIYNITTLVHTVPSVFAVTASNLMVAIYNASANNKDDNVEAKSIMKGDMSNK